MKKKQYMQPHTTMVRLHSECLMLEASKVETTDNTGGGTSGPSNGGNGGSSELAKEHYWGEDFDVWNTWK